MSALLYLSSKDFDVVQGQKGRVMCNRIRGFSLLLFFSNACHHCGDLIPIFKKLPGTISGCQFGLINVSADKNCVAMSRGTLSEIQYVPYIVMYVDGKPVMKYAGPYDITEIKRFVLEVSKRIKSKQTFANNSAVTKDPRGGIPAYTLGKPLYGPDSKICYLKWNHAYTANSGGQRPQAQHVPLPSGAGMSYQGATPGQQYGQQQGQYGQQQGQQGQYGQQQGQYSQQQGQPGQQMGQVHLQHQGSGNPNMPYMSLSGMN